jgi:putative ABC transport system permease protein
MLIFKTAFLNLFRRKSRTILALLGIIIGITALIVLVSIVDGVYQDTSEVLGKMQGLMVYEKTLVSPVFGVMDDSFENKLKSISGVYKVVPEALVLVSKIDNSYFEGQGGFVRLFGARPEEFKYSVYGTILDGLSNNEMLDPNDKFKVIISDDIADKYKKSKNNSIKINGDTYEIKSVFEANTSMSKSLIIGRLQDVKETGNIDSDKVSMYHVTPNDPAGSDKLKTKIEFRFEDLQAKTAQEQGQQLGDLLNQLKFIVVIVSIVAAIVAGIGIINTMLMSVMERTKEIGTLKAIGWTNKNVMYMIALESIMIGVLGGVIGIIIGVLGSQLIAVSAGLKVFIGLELIIESFLFAFFIGLVAGLYPAYIASKLNPIEALRSE